MTNLMTEEEAVGTASVSDVTLFGKKSLSPLGAGAGRGGGKVLSGYGSLGREEGKAGSPLREDSDEDEDYGSEEEGSHKKGRRSFLEERYSDEDVDEEVEGEEPLTRRSSRGSRGARPAAVALRKKSR